MKNSKYRLKYELQTEKDMRQKFMMFETGRSYDEFDFSRNSK